MFRLISRSFSSAAPRITPLEPGLVHIKSCIPIGEQVKLANLALKEGKRLTGGFWNRDRTLNCTKNRGRIFNAVDAFPREFLSTCIDSLTLARNADRTLPSMHPTHLILLYYQTLGKTPHIPWHQDNGDNDGKGNYPVVSLSLGDSCDFLICHKKPQTSTSHPVSHPKNLAHRVTLQSGDALVFGGDCRYIWHAIYNTHPDTCPPEVPLEGVRLNFTFRYAPEILGKEEDFARIDPDIKKDNQFFKLSKME